MGKAMHKSMFFLCLFQMVLDLDALILRLYSGRYYVFFEPLQDDHHVGLFFATMTSSLDIILLITLLL